MTSRTLDPEGLQVKINCMNQLEVDMSIDQMNTVFKNHRGRMPNSRTEAENFINNFIYKKLIDRGLVSPKRQ